MNFKRDSNKIIDCGESTTLKQLRRSSDIAVPAIRDQRFDEQNSFINDQNSTLYIPEEFQRPSSSDDIYPSYSPDKNHTIKRTHATDSLTNLVHPPNTPNNEDDIIVPTGEAIYFEESISSDTEDFSTIINDILSEHTSILWTAESVNTLKEIMDLVNKTKIMEPLGYIVKYYINKHRPREKEYNILTVDVPAETISRDMMILAYICEIHIKKHHKESTVIFQDLIYRCFGRVIFDVINEIYIQSNNLYNNSRNERIRKDWPLSFDEMYLISTLNSVIGSGTSESKSMILSAYFMTCQIMELDRGTNLLLFMETLCLRTEDLDLSVLTSEQIHAGMEVLRTKRKIYLRILLVLCDYLLHENVTQSVVTHDNKSDRSGVTFGNNWLFSKSTINNNTELKNYLNDVAVEMIIALTGFLLIN